MSPLKRFVLASVAILSCVLHTTALAATANSTGGDSASANADAKGSSKREGGPPSIFEDGQISTKDNAQITVHIYVSQIKEPIDKVMVYPYPVRPPKTAACATPLPTDDKSIKGMLLHSGYANRTSKERAYPMGGFRWQYALRAAIKKSGCDVPHTCLTLYPWIHRVQPYALRECKLRNEYETERWARCRKAVDFWEAKHGEGEDEAARLGLVPAKLKRKAFGVYTAQIPAGTWWIQCSRDVPGITYHWLQPITVTSNEKQDVSLDENNAIAITGGW